MWKGVNGIIESYSGNDTGSGSLYIHETEKDNLNYPTATGFSLKGITFLSGGATISASDFLWD